MKRFAPPLSGAHILGTDELGRDVLARLMMGGRVSLSIGIVAMVIAMAVGILVGAFAGFYGGVLGAVLMRFVDAVLCFPTIFLLLALAALTEPGLVTTTLLIAATAWMERRARCGSAGPCAARARIRDRRDCVRFVEPADHVPRAGAECHRADRGGGDAERRQGDPA